MRLVALLDNREKPRFAKAPRFRFVHLPVQVLRHAAQVIFRYSDHHFKEVGYWLKKITGAQIGFYEARECPRTPHS